MSVCGHRNHIDPLRTFKGVHRATGHTIMAGRLTSLDLKYWTTVSLFRLAQFKFAKFGESFGLQT